MQKETEEITTQAVGQPTSVNDDDAEKNLSLTSKWQKKPEKPLPVLSSLKLISLLKREIFVIFQDIFGNMAEIKDHKTILIFFFKKGGGA